MRNKIKKNKNLINQIKHYNMRNEEKYIHEIKLGGDDEFANRFNYVSWLWQRYSDTNDEKYLDEHFKAKLALEQGYPMSFLHEYKTALPPKQIK